MATTINNTRTTAEGDEVLSFVLGVLLVFIVGALLLFYALPALRQPSPSTSPTPLLNTNGLQVTPPSPAVNSGPSGSYGY